MLECNFIEVYTKFKLDFYSKVFSHFETREASLTAVETFCTEVIHALRNPTINEFARFVRISLPNAAHKIQNLIKKGYVIKSRSEHDKREFTLSVTEKYFTYYDISISYLREVVRRMDERFSQEEIAQFSRTLEIISTELMPEIALKDSPDDIAGSLLNYISPK